MTYKGATAPQNNGLRSMWGEGAPLLTLDIVQEQEDKIIFFGCTGRAPLVCAPATGHWGPLGATQPPHAPPNPPASALQPSLPPAHGLSAVQPCGSRTLRTHKQPVPLVRPHHCAPPTQPHHIHFSFLHAHSHYTRSSHILRLCGRAHAVLHSHAWMRSARRSTHCRSRGCYGRWPWPGWQSPSTAVDERQRGEAVTPCKEARKAHKYTPIVGNKQGEGGWVRAVPHHHRTHGPRGPTRGLHNHVSVGH